jgi:DNA-binding NarL/FixJ family response regulator
MRVIIAEDEVLLREGIARILGDEGYEVVALAGGHDDLMGKVAAHRPELVVTDIRMPPTFTDEGLAAARQIRRTHPGTRIVVLSQHVDTAGAVELLADGADGIGYLLKRRVMNLDEFLDSVRRVAAGGSAIDPEVISAMVRREVRDSRDGGADAAIASLTPRRVEVLELMAQGYSNARIARELVVTEKAVARSIALIFQTLGLPPDPDEHRRVIAVIRYLNGGRPGGR